jgi:hypothetical protein
MYLYVPNWVFYILLVILVILGVMVVVRIAGMVICLFT